MPRHLMLLASVVCVVLSGCGGSAPVPNRQQVSQPTAADPAADSTPVAMVDDLVISEPVRHKNLTIFPVLSKSLRSEDRFMTLNEGLKAGTVEIREMGARLNVSGELEVAAQTAANPSDQDQSIVEDEIESEATGNADSLFAANDVNRLVVINRGDRPLYLMPGEIIVGGSQDRTIGEELVIAATGKPVPIDVFCVEHGRWGARDVTMASENLYALIDDPEDFEELASEANRGKFVAKAGNLGKSGRVAVQAGAGQGKVWDEVAKANSASGANWSSGAFTANYCDKNVLEQLQPYLDALNLSVSKHERIVGVVVAINGKIETVDVFESTPLFLKLWPQLLQSYAFDASLVDDADDAKKVAASSDAEAFLSSVLRDQDAGSRKTDGGLVVSRHETNDRISFSAGAAGGMGGGMMGGMGAAAGPVHAAGYSK